MPQTTSMAYRCPLAHVWVALASRNPACGNEVVVCYPFQFIVPGLFPFTNTAPPPCPLTPPATGACCPAGYAAPAPGLTLTATGCHQA